MTDPRNTGERAHKGTTPADRPASALAVIAVLNIRSERWDRRGASRLALVAFCLCFTSQVIGSHHSLAVAEEVRGVFASIAFAATRTFMTWFLYVAIEPFVRRFRPEFLISWSRLLAFAVFGCVSEVFLYTVMTFGPSDWYFASARNIRDAIAAS